MCVCVCVCVCVGVHALTCVCVYMNKKTKRRDVHTRNKHPYICAGENRKQTRSCMRNTHRYIRTRIHASRYNALFASVWGSFRLMLLISVLSEGTKRGKKQLQWLPISTTGLWAFLICGGSHVLISSSSAGKSIFGREWTFVGLQMDNDLQGKKGEG